MRSIRRVYFALAVLALLWGGCTMAVFAQPVEAQSSVRARMIAATVRVYCDLPGGARGFGSGVLVDYQQRGYVVTNHHVVDGRRGLPSYSHAGGSWRLANVLATDATMDLAVLDAGPHTTGAAQPAEFVASARYTGCGFAGDGKWHAHPLAPADWTGIGRGKYSWVEFRGTNCQGDSGGPIFDAAGRVIGVMWGGGPGSPTVIATVGIPFREILAKAAEVK